VYIPPCNPATRTSRHSRFIEFSAEANEPWAARAQGVTGLEPTILFSPAAPAPAHGHDIRTPFCRICRGRYQAQRNPRRRSHESVSSASHIRQSRPSAKSSSDIPARSQKTFHSSARRSGNAFFRSSTHNPQRGPRSRLRGKVTRRPLHTARRGQNGRQDGGLQATKPLQLSCYGAAGSGVQLFVRRVEDNCCFALIF